MARRKKVRRKRNPLLPSKARNELAILPRDAVQLPLVDGLNAPILLLAPFAPESLCNGCPAAKPIDQGRVFVLHGSRTIRKFFGLSRGHRSEASSDDNPQALRHTFEMAWEGETPEYKAECGARLRRARIAVGYDSLRAFAHDTQTDDDNLGNWERGVALVPPSYVSLLKRTVGIDHAWIYDEDASRLDGKLQRALLTKDRRKQD